MSNRLLRAAFTQERQQTFVPSAIPAPVLGWNARDSLDGMAPGYAVQLDNFFPYNGFVTLRQGSIDWTSGLGGAVQTLARWADATTEKVVAGANGQLWHVFNGGKTSLASGFSLDEWQWDTVKGSRTLGTAYLYLVNGTDTPQTYDGTTVAAVTWAPKAGQPSLTITNLHNIHVAKDLLFLAEKDQLGFWHSDKGTVSPAAELSWFDLGTILPGGGELVAIGSYTLEGGEGPDDYTCFVASTGWVAVYSGNDPAQATDWSIVGRYNLGQALGKRCVLEIAGDVIVLTVNGYISLRQFIQIGGLERQSFAFNDNIQPEVVRQTVDYKTEFGWQPILVPNLTLALFNVPQSSNNFVQHIVNTQTAAWARIKDWNGCCWLSGDDNLVFGTADGRVVEAQVGGTDVGNVPVRGDALTTFSYFGQRGTNKLFQTYRPILETIGTVQIATTMAIDFDPNVSLPAFGTLPVDNAGLWDQGEWDTAEWGGAPITRNDWYTIGQWGYSGAVRLGVSSTGTRCRWKSTDVNYTPGGVP